MRLSGKGGNGPAKPLYRILDGSNEVAMTFRAKDLQAARGMLNKNTRTLRFGPYTLERFVDGAWGAA